MNALAAAGADPVYRDPDRPVAERVADLLARMDLDEKLAQLGSAWIFQLASGTALDEERAAPLLRHGIGHITRISGASSLRAVEAAELANAIQHHLLTRTRLGIPAIVHEEILTGLAAWKAATFPTPLAWGAAFDPELVTELGAAVGGSMRALGIHQGLAPVLDVIRDPRWGRVDECIAEDPYLVGTVGTSFVRGVQSQGVHATLKHFAGYSASQAGRNFGPVHAGPRELADVLLEASRGVAEARGCQIYIVHVSPAEPDAVWVTEVWDSKADHDASLSLPATQALIKRGRPLIAGFSDRLETTVLGGLGLE